MESVQKKMATIILAYLLRLDYAVQQTNHIGTKGFSMKFVLYLFMSCVWFVVAKYVGLEIAFATAFGLLFVELIEIQSKIGDKI